MATAVIQLHLCHRCTFVINSVSTTSFCHRCTFANSSDSTTSFCHRCTFVISSNSTTSYCRRRTDSDTRRSYLCTKALNEERRHACFPSSTCKLFVSDIQRKICGAGSGTAFIFSQSLVCTSCTYINTVYTRAFSSSIILYSVHIRTIKPVHS